MIIIMLCAGRGKRLGPKTTNLPKCMVKVKNKPIIDWSKNFRKKFKKTIIVCGYKKKIIINKFKHDSKVSFSINKNYKTTNMVNSLFSVKKSQIKKENIVICYSDIIFDPKIFKVLTKKKFTFMPVKTNWLKLWKKRMPIHKIKNDAENIETKNYEVMTIGGKIKKKWPKFQFMGLVKIMNRDFFKLKKFFKTQDKNIDFTNFLNLAIRNKIIKLKYSKTKMDWFEIDNLEDLKYTESIKIKW